MQEKLTTKLLADAELILLLTDWNDVVIDLRETLESSQQISVLPFDTIPLNNHKLALIKINEIISKNRPEVFAAKDILTINFEDVGDIRQSISWKLLKAVIINKTLNKDNRPDVDKELERVITQPRSEESIWQNPKF
ncbi:MAG TPA: hypothetical protein VIK81_00555 [Patescibacteria group bacterium]